LDTAYSERLDEKKIVQLVPLPVLELDTLILKVNRILLYSVW
jgi:hypothetical protein